MRQDSRLLWGLQRTAASSWWVQSVVLGSWVQSSSEFSVPTQATLSRKMGPVPWPKEELNKPVLSVCIRQTEYPTRRQIRSIELFYYVMYVYMKTVLWKYICFSLAKTVGQGEVARTDISPRDSTYLFSKYSSKQLPILRYFWVFIWKILSSSICLANLVKYFGLVCTLGICKCIQRDRER